MSTLPETILQFGTGRFLRAFADLFIHQANEQGQAVGRIVVIQATGAERAAALNARGGRYQVLVRGREKGEVVERVEPCASISRCLVASHQWPEILAFARSPELRVILSNTTEKGYELHPGDTASSTPPASFPAKLLAVLRARFEAGQPPVTVVPCELREHNADELRQIIAGLVQSWGLPDDFRAWLFDRCAWLNTLVDRIVTGTPADHPLLAEDPLLIACEPYALWAIQRHPRADVFLQHSAVVWTNDVEPYFLRKVRILNGAHTALVIRAMPRGFTTVRQAVEDPEIGPWLERLLMEEVVPVLEGRVEQPADFARETLERFRNPFLEHRLSDIALHHETKVRVRLVPTRDEFRAKFGRNPPLLDELLAEAGVFGRMKEEG